jgi:drug/metabolite transporter (DMT)-like permease
VNKTLQAHIALFIAQLLYAISFVIAKDVTHDHIAPFGLVVFRAAGATILLWLTQVTFIKEKVERKDILKMLLLAVFGVAINQSLFLTGLHLTSPISAAIMMITTPILVLIIAAIIIRERITWLKSTGVLFGFAGAAALMYSSSTSARALDDPLGDLFVLINAMSWGTYLVLVKPLMKKYHTVTILSWVFLFGFFLVLPIGYKQAAAVNWDGFDGYAWFAFLFIIIGTTYLAYILNTYALKALSPSVVSAYIYLQPVLTALIAISMHRDELNWAKCGSAALIFAGVYLVSFQPNQQKMK